MVIKALLLSFMNNRLWGTETTQRNFGTLNALVTKRFLTSQYNCTLFRLSIWAGLFINSLSVDRNIKRHARYVWSFWLARPVSDRDTRTLTGTMHVCTACERLSVASVDPGTLLQVGFVSGTPPRRKPNSDLA